MKEQIKTLKQGDHICPIHESLAEQMAIVVTFTQDGLRQRERCVYVADDITVEQVRDAFTLAGIDIAHEEGRGALRLLTKQETYLRFDKFSPQKMIEFIHELEMSALKDGFAGLRFIGEMTWILGLEAKEHQLIEYEALLNEYAEGSKTTILCQYQHSHFDSTLIHDILRTHPKVILTELLCINPYYEPPQLILQQGKIEESDFKNRLVNWWLLRLKEINKRLQTTETLVGISGRIARLGGWIVDLPGFEVTWSDEACAIHDVPVDTVPSIEDVIHFYAPELQQVFSSHFNACVSNGTPFDLELELITAKKRRIWVRAIGQPEINVDGVITRIHGAFQDIDRHKRAEESLRESEERFRTMFAATATGIATSTPQGGFLQANSAYCQMLGYTEDELRVCNFAQLTHPDDIALNIALRDEVLSGVRDSFIMEKRYLKKDGGILWTRCSVSAARNANREITMLIVVAENITEQKHAEARFRRLVDSNVQSVIFWNTKGEISGSNDAFLNLTGYTRDDLTAGRINWAAMTPPEYADRDRRALRELATTGVSATYEKEWIRKDGTRVPILLGAAVFEDNREEGVCFVLDLTERKRTESVLHLRDRAIQAVSQAILITDCSLPDNPIVYVSPSFTKITGYSAEEIIGQNCRLLQGKNTDPLAVTQLREAIQQERGCTVELLNYQKDGTMFWNNLTISPVREPGGKLTHFVGVQTDVTSRRQLEDQLHQSQKMEAIGQLAGGIAHDFNNLLTVINGYADVLIGSLATNDPSQRFLGLIKEAGEQSSALTSQLLAFSKNQFLSPEVININKVIQKVEKMLRRIIGEDVLLSAVLSDTLGSVMADPTQIEQILLNLAVNARDAMPRGGKLTIETQHIELDESYARTHPGVQPGSYVMLAVTDSGEGMSEDIRQHIFEPFFTTKDVGKGTGLGLSVVHGIVKQSEGSIEVYSEVGQGTCFKIYLPQIACSIITEAPSAETQSIQGGKETILLVEDEANVREFARHVLSGYGYTILVAGNAKEALRISELHKAPIHLLLTDVAMPETGGRALAEQLQPTRPHMKVLFMSGYTEDAVVRHGILHDQVNFLQKPYSPRALAQRVREVLQ
jgi:PAS domain S-box-containing protein